MGQYPSAREHRRRQQQQRRHLRRLQEQAANPYNWYGLGHGYAVNPTPRENAAEVAASRPAKRTKRYWQDGQSWDGPVWGLTRSSGDKLNLYYDPDVPKDKIKDICWHDPLPRQPCCLCHSHRGLHDLGNNLYMGGVIPPHAAYAGPPAGEAARFQVIESASTAATSTEGGRGRGGGSDSDSGSGSNRSGSENEGREGAGGGRADGRSEGGGGNGSASSRMGSGSDRGRDGAESDGGDSGEERSRSEWSGANEEGKTSIHSDSSDGSSGGSTRRRTPSEGERGRGTKERGRSPKGKEPETRSGGGGCGCGPHCVAAEGALEWPSRSGGPGAFEEHRPSRSGNIYYQPDDSGRLRSRSWVRVSPKMKERRPRQEQEESGEGSQQRSPNHGESSRRPGPTSAHQHKGTHAPSLRKKTFSAGESAGDVIVGVARLNNTYADSFDIDALAKRRAISDTASSASCRTYLFSAGHGAGYSTGNQTSACGPVGYATGSSSGSSLGYTVNPHTSGDCTGWTAIASPSTTLLPSGTKSEMTASKGEKRKRRKET